MSHNELSQIEKQRYFRNTQLPEFGNSGQLLLKKSKILIVGQGGLGSPVAYYLAAAGIGSLTLMDFDAVDVSNLQRQILHFDRNIGMNKAKSAQEKLSQQNPYININIIPEKLDESNGPAIVQQFDFVIDAVDNFPAKFLINDLCVRHSIAFCHAGVQEFSGQCLTYKPGTTCLRCIFGQEIEKELADHQRIPSSQLGILGSIAGLLGSIQATEAIKHILGIGQPLYNTILSIDALQMNWQKIPVQINPQCILDHAAI